MQLRSGRSVEGQTLPPIARDSKSRQSLSKACRNGAAGLQGTQTHPRRDCCIQSFEGRRWARHKAQPTESTRQLPPDHEGSRNNEARRRRNRHYRFIPKESPDLSEHVDKGTRDLTKLLWLLCQPKMDFL